MRRANDDLLNLVALYVDDREYGPNVVDRVAAAAWDVWRNEATAEERRRFDGFRAFLADVQREVRS